MSKIDEIRKDYEKISGIHFHCREDINRLCDMVERRDQALDFAKEKLIAHGYPYSSAKIDNILEKGKE